MGQTLKTRSLNSLALPFETDVKRLNADPAFFTRYFPLIDAI